MLRKLLVHFHALRLQAFCGKHLVGHDTLCNNPRRRMDPVRRKQDCCRKKEYRKKHERHKPPSLFLLGGFISHRAVCLSKQLSIQPSDQAPDPPDRMRQPVRIAEQQIHHKSDCKRRHMIYREHVIPPTFSHPQFLSCLLKYFPLHQIPQTVVLYILSHLRTGNRNNCPPQKRPEAP